MTDPLAIIELATKQSEQLLTLAENEQWSEFEQLELQRQQTIAQIQLHNLEPASQQHAAIQNKLTHLIRLNQKLENICRNQRQLVATELQKFNQGNKAIKAYSE